MRSKIAVMAVGSLVCWVSLVTSVQAQEANRIGVVNTKEVFESHPDAQKAKEVLVKEYQIHQQAIKEQEEKINKLKQQLEGNPLLSKEEKEKQSLAIKQKINSLLEYKDKAEEDLSKREEELTKPIISAIYQTISDIAREKGLQLVLEEKDEFLVYWTDEMDITKGVIERLKNKPNVEKNGKGSK